MRAALGSSYSGLEEGQFTSLEVKSIKKLVIHGNFYLHPYSNPELFHIGNTGKADVMGIYNILFMVKKGLIKKEMTNKVITFVWYSQ